jgi:hypothetical protein
MLDGLARSSISVGQPLLARYGHEIGGVAELLGAAGDHLISERPGGDAFASPRVSLRCFRLGDPAIQSAAKFSNRRFALNTR